MKDHVIKSVRLSRSLVDVVERHAVELGLTFADIVDAGLRKEVGMAVNARTEVLKGVAEWLRDNYPNKKNFPQNVTLLVFRHIQSDPTLSRDYAAAIRDDDGSVEKYRRQTLHRLVGQAVRRVLDAKVIGRSIELDPDVELIQTHALLEPLV